MAYGKASAEGICLLGSNISPSSRTRPVAMNHSQIRRPHGRSSMRDLTTRCSTWGDTASGLLTVSAKSATARDNIVTWVRHGAEHVDTAWPGGPVEAYGRRLSQRAPPTAEPSRLLRRFSVVHQPHQPPAYFGVVDRESTLSDAWPKSSAARSMYHGCIGARSSWAGYDFQNKAGILSRFRFTIWLIR
jgi:hypothetical protein